MSLEITLRTIGHETILQFSLLTSTNSSGPTMFQTQYTGNITEVYFFGIHGILSVSSVASFTFPSIVAALMCEEEFTDKYCGAVIPLNILSVMCQNALTVTSLKAFLNVCQIVNAGLTTYECDASGQITNQITAQKCAYPAHSIWSLLILAEIFGVSKVTQSCTQQLLRKVMMTRAPQPVVDNSIETQLEIFARLFANFVSPDGSPLVVTSDQVLALRDRLETHFVQFGPSLGPTLPQLAQQLQHSIQPSHSSMQRQLSQDQQLYTPQQQQHQFVPQSAPPSHQPHQMINEVLPNSSSSSYGKSNSTNRNLVQSSVGRISLSNMNTALTLSAQVQYPQGYQQHQQSQILMTPQQLFESSQSQQFAHSQQQFIQPHAQQQPLSQYQQTPQYTSQYANQLVNSTPLISSASIARRQSSVNVNNTTSNADSASSMFDDDDTPIKRHNQTRQTVPAQSQFQSQPAQSSHVTPQEVQFRQEPQIRQSSVSTRLNADQESHLEMRRSGPQLERSVSPLGQQQIREQRPQFKQRNQQPTEDQYQQRDQSNEQQREDLGPYAHLMATPNRRTATPSRDRRSLTASTPFTPDSLSQSFSSFGHTNSVTKPRTPVTNMSHSNSSRPGSRSTTPTRGRPVAPPHSHQGSVHSGGSGGSQNNYDVNDSYYIDEDSLFVPGGGNRGNVSEEQLLESREIAYLRLQRQREIERGQAAKRDSERYLRENRLKSLQLKADVARLNAISNMRTSRSASRSSSSSRGGRNISHIRSVSPYHNSSSGGGGGGGGGGRYDTTTGSGSSSFNVGTAAASSSSSSFSSHSTAGYPIKSILKGGNSPRTASNTQANSATTNVIVRSGSAPPQRPVSSGGPSNHSSPSNAQSAADRRPRAAPHVTPSTNLDETQLFKYLKRGQAQASTNKGETTSHNPRSPSSHNRYNPQNNSHSLQHNHITYTEDPQTDNDSENDEHLHSNTSTTNSAHKIDEAQRLAAVRIRAKRKEDREKEQREKEKKEQRERDKFKRRDEKIALFKDRQQTPLTTDFLTSATPESNGYTATHKTSLKTNSRSQSPYTPNAARRLSASNTSSTPIVSQYDANTISNRRPDVRPSDTTDSNVDLSRIANYQQQYSAEALAAVGLGMSPNLVRNNNTATSKIASTNKMVGVVKKTSKLTVPTQTVPNSSKSRTVTHKADTHDLILHSPLKDPSLKNSAGGRYDHITEEFDHDFDLLVNGHFDLESSSSQNNESGFMSLSNDSFARSDEGDGGGGGNKTANVFLLHIIRAYNLTECLGGTNAYIDCDWAQYGRVATQCVFNTTSPEFQTSLRFISPLLITERMIRDKTLPFPRQSVSTDTSQRSSRGGVTVRMSDLGVDSSLPLIRVSVFNKNQSISNECIATGEIDIYSILYSHYCSSGGGGSDEGELSAVSDQLHTIELMDYSGKYAGSLDISIEF